LGKIECKNKFCIDFFHNFDSTTTSFLKRSNIISHLLGRKLGKIISPRDNKNKILKHEGQWPHAFGILLVLAQGLIILLFLARGLIIFSSLRLKKYYCIIIFLLIYSYTYTLNSRYNKLARQASFVCYIK